MPDDLEESGDVSIMFTSVSNVLILVIAAAVFHGRVSILLTLAHTIRTKTIKEINCIRFTIRCIVR